MKAIRVGLLGLGTVGSGVVKIIQDHQDKLMHQVGCPVTIKKVLVKDVEKKREVDLPKEVLTTEVYDVIDDPDVDVVIEVIGGVEQTKQYLVDALRSKKHVVTANKDLMAVYGSELLAEAKENGCDIYFEASVAGGIPILRTLEEGALIRSNYKNDGNCERHNKLYLNQNDQREKPIRGSAQGSAGSRFCRS